MSINQDITNLPTPPNRSDSPSDFSDKADAFLAALPTLQTELNTYADEANTTQTAINTSETNAATSEQNAQDWATDLTGLVVSTDYSAKAYAVSTNLVPDGSSKEWSLKTDGSVDTTEFSAKAYALGGTGVTDVTGAAKEWAVKTGTTVDGSDYSAKDYAISLGTITDGSAKEWAVNTGGTVDATEYSAKDYASSQNLISTGSSKDWAIKTGSTVDGTEFSAKKYANDAESSASAAAATAGATAWSAGTTYNTNDAAIGSDGNTYRSLIDNNTGNDPVLGDGSNWLNLTATLSDQEVRDLFSAGGDLNYDPSTGVFSVTTSTVPDVLKPDIISPFDGETDIGETPIIKTGGYYSLFGIDQASAQFQIATDTSFTNIVYDSGVLGPATEHQVPTGNLLEDTTYYVRVEFKDTNNNPSGFSYLSEFTTVSSFFDFDDPGNIGIAFGGGFFAGKVVSDVDGLTYAIIVSDGDGDTDRTGAGDKKWRATNTSLTEAQTLSDGKSVMDHIVTNETLSDFPAFEWIQNTLNSGSGLNGYTDWYLPARDELELVYRHFKPTTDNNNDGTRNSGSEFGADGATYGTNNSSDPNYPGYTLTDPSQTTVTSFQDGGADHLNIGSYLSSTQGDEILIWAGTPLDGSQTFVTKEGSPSNVRAVRRVQV